MPKIKYRFNQETLSYHKIETSFKKRLLKTIPSVISAFVFGLAGIIIYTYTFDSPKERQLKRENKQLELQYKIIGKKIQQIESVLFDLQYRDDNIYRTIFEVEPIPETMRNAGYGGMNRYEELEGYDNSDLVINTSKRIDKLMKQLYVQSKSFDEIVRLAKSKEKWLASMPAIIPILFKDHYKFLSHFGVRYDPVYKNTVKMHEGIDLAGAVGTNVRSTGEGTVKVAEYTGGGYGNEIIVDHGFGYTTRYAHLSKIIVKPGQKVKRGEIIGKLGSTGKSTGPHLHYEVRKNNVPMNPVNFFYLDMSPAEYDKMIEMSAQEGGIALD
ncbi:MAG: peptidase M23 [Bacteroidetes bacterium GWA2_32_17]|nr:MAG: peptidase M23 [Bacteroidetes bacterium GWA2_32_17]